MKLNFMRELLILVFLLVIIFFVVGVVFLEAVPRDEDFPKVISYRAESSVLRALREIENSNEKNTENNQNLLKSYTIESSELNNYATNKNYESGKTDPFSELDYANKQTTNQ